MTATPDIPGYRVEGIIGEGGFATVYHGWQIAVGREVAVKVDNRVLRSERDWRRFIREVTAAGRLSGHPHVVDVYDAGPLDDGRPYIVMEFCPGGSLHDAVRRDGVMSPAQVRDLGIKIADALAAAHAAGVLHRDIKPANILINRYDMVGLSDFGMASILAPDRKQSVTREALTPAYASPERFRGHEPTVACDLYSLAATMYNLLAGRPPRFPADGHDLSVAELISLHNRPLDDIPGVPSALMSTLRQTLSADPAMRPRGAAEFRDALIAAPESDPEPRHITLTESATSRRLGDVQAARGAKPAAARHAKRRHPASGNGADRAAKRRRRGTRLAALSATCVVVVVAVTLLGVREFSPGNPPLSPRAHGSSAPPQVQTQAGYLTKRLVGSGERIKGCNASAQPAAGADTTVNCTVRQQGISVSASSFAVAFTAQVTAFIPQDIYEESPGLNAYLRMTIPAGMPIVPSQNPMSNFGSGTPQSCRYPGFSGYHYDGPGVVAGRLYCYERSGTYYLVRTYDNDEYEAEHTEDFVVVESSRNLPALINWYASGPV